MNKNYLILFTKFSREMLPRTDIWSGSSSIFLLVNSADTPQADLNTGFQQALLVGPPVHSGERGDFKVMPIIGMALRHENSQE